MRLIDRLRAIAGHSAERRVPHPKPAAWMKDPAWRGIETRPATASETVRLYTGERWQPEEDRRPMEHDQHHPLDQEDLSDLDRELSQRPLRRRPSIETPIEPFQAPRDALDRIPHAYRAIAEDVVVAVSAMILKAEEARLMAVKFLEQCDQQGRWHSDFVHDYIAHETAAAEAYTAQWQKTIEELTAKRDAARQLTGPTTKPEEPKT
jgi:hypothetical protein